MSAFKKHLILTTANDICKYIADEYGVDVDNLAVAEIINCDLFLYPDTKEPDEFDDMFIEGEYE